MGRGGGGSEGRVTYSLQDGLLAAPPAPYSSKAHPHAVVLSVGSFTFTSEEPMDAGAIAGTAQRPWGCTGQEREWAALHGTKHQLLAPRDAKAKGP
jgi:hypothetical protein